MTCASEFGEYRKSFFKTTTTLLGDLEKTPKGQRYIEVPLADQMNV